MPGNRRITNFYRPTSGHASDESHLRAGTSSAQESSHFDALLSLRLFATDIYPDARLHIYSKLDILCWIRKYLKGTLEYDKILNSCFGGLFEILVHSSLISCKLIHALLCRQLVTKKKYELWMVFDGQSIRFALLDFGLVTGFPCEEFPEGYDPEEQSFPAHDKRYFFDDFIGNCKATLADLAVELKTSKKMTSDRKLGIALILIVDGVLIAQHQTHRPTFKYVQMLEDVDKFMFFPWGRESYLKTIDGMMSGPKVPGRGDDHLNTFIQQLQQKTKYINGFPLALQFIAFKNISGLLEMIPTATLYSRTFLQWSYQRFPGQITLQLLEVLQDWHKS